MNILLLYNSTQTFTNTVFEHLSSFGKYSQNNIFYCHADEISLLDLDLSYFDAIGIHYTIRLPFDQISSSVDSALQSFKGLKFLFIQDEYDYTQRAWHWINKLGINLVFTVVPAESIEIVYPKAEFSQTRFVSNLTGYVPEKLPYIDKVLPPSKRTIMIGYRGRQLPVRYGKLGIEKILIGQEVKRYCEQLKINCDIEWTENARIYGTQWYDFVGACKSMLGSESGSNVFDWDGTLNEQIKQYRLEHGNATDEMIYQNLIEPKEIDGIMNQISPRVFEAIALRTVLVLFEGTYSNVIIPDVHFISLKKDFSNLKDVIARLNDDHYVDAMTERAWQDIILSKRYSYQSFIEFVDNELDNSKVDLENDVTYYHDTLNESDTFSTPTLISTRPLRTPSPQLITKYSPSESFLKQLMIYVWLKSPQSVRQKVKVVISRLYRKTRL